MPTLTVQINEVNTYLSIIVSLVAIGGALSAVIFWRFATVFLQKKDAEERFKSINDALKQGASDFNRLDKDFERHRDHVGDLSERIDLKLENQNKILEQEFRHLNNNILQLVQNSDKALKIGMRNQDEIDLLKRKMT